MKTERLPVVLSEDEKVKRGQYLAEWLQQRDRLVLELKHHQARYRQEIKEADSTIAELSLALRTGKEYRSVEVYERFDWDKGTVEIFRSDTMERLHERKITDEERQTRIPQTDPEVLDVEMGG